MTPPAAQDEPRPPRDDGDDPPRKPRRRGRRRRRLARLALWTLAALALLLALAVFLGGGPWARERVRRLAEARLSEYFGRQVTVGSVAYGAAPLHVEAENVVIPGAREGEPPFARLPFVRVEASVAGFFNPRLNVDQVEAQAPEIHLLFYDDGGNNLPRFGSGGDGGGVEVHVGRVTVDEGSVYFGDRRVPVSFDAAPVRATLAGDAAVPLPEKHLEATVVAQDLNARLPDAVPWGGSASARGVLSPGRVEITAGRVQGPDLSARFAGVYLFGDGETGGGTVGGNGQIEIDAHGSAALANRLGYLEEPIDGSFHFAGQVDLAPSGTTYRGRFDSPEIRFLSRRFTAVEAALRGDPAALSVDVERAGHAGGALTGRVEVELGGGDAVLSVAAATSAAPQGRGAEAEGGRPVTLRAHAEDLAVAALVHDLDLGSSPVGALRGRLDADLVYRFVSDHPRQGDGSGTLRVDAVSSRAGGLKVAGRIPLTVRGGVVRSDGAELTAPGQRLTASGSWDLDAEAGSFTYALASERLGVLAGALAAQMGVAAEPPPAWLPSAGTGTVDGSAEVSLGANGAAVRAQALVELAALHTAALDLERVTAPLTWADGVVSTTDLVAEGSGQRLLLSGRWDLAAAAGGAELRLASDDLARLADLVPADGGGEEGGEPPPWRPSGGSGGTQGEIYRAADGSLSGRADFELSGVVLPSATLERVGGSLRLADGELQDVRLEATCQDGAILARGSLPLPPLGDGGGSATAAPAWTERPLTFVVDAVDWPVGTLLALLPAAPAADGLISGRVQAAGSLALPRLNAELTVEPLRLAGVEIDRASVVALLEDGVVTVQRLRIEAPAGEMTAQGRFAVDGSEMDVSLAADALDLAAAPFAERVPGSLSGRLSLDAAVSGSFAAPRLRLAVAGSGLAVAGAPLGRQGEARLTADWADHRLQVDGSLLGLVRLAGGGSLDEESADLSLQLVDGDLGALLRVLAPPVAVAEDEEPSALAELGQVEGSFAGTLTVRGQFSGPPDVALSLDHLSADYAGHPVSNLEPVVARFEPGLVRIETLYLGEPEAGSELFVTGTLGVGEEGVPLDLRLQLDLAAEWLQLLPGDLRYGGRVRALAAVRGSLAAPQVDGQAEMADGRVVLPGFPHPAEELDAVALLYPGRVVLDSLGARFAGGSLRAAGEVTLPSEQTSLGYRFQVAAVDVAVRFPEGFLLRGDANLSINSTADGRAVSGVVELERAFYLEDVPVGVIQLLQQVFEPARLEAGSADPQLAATQINVAVQGPGALRVRNNVADLGGDVDLVLRGSAADPVIFGRVEVTPGGKILYSENEYRVERGLLTFANPYRIDPVIDFVATTEVRSYDITLNLSGTLDRLDATFTSDPPLADLEVVSLLTLGRPLGDASQLTTDPVGGTSRAAEQLLYGQAASIVSERVNNLFGFDRFRVSPVTGTAAGSSSLAVTVGQQLSRDVFVTYTRDPSTPEVDLIQVEWQVRDNVVVVLTRKGDGTYAMDVQVERRF